MSATYRVVVFSHLRWNFVYQRPQHLLSRLAARHPVVFVEEPVPDPGPPRWEWMSPERNLTVYRPHTPIETPGFCAAQCSALEALWPELQAELEPGPLVTWLYTPMALPLARRLESDVAVYDCMDELSLFAGAPPELLCHEAELLDWVDLVFAGGPSLYQAKRDRHPDVHCFPSSVDATHFRQVSNGVVEPAEQAGLPRPRLGFFGVIDERLDTAVVAALASLHPDWSIVLVGPVIKIDPATLPRLPNIHYFGQRSYADLPPLLAGWDVCLLPFARNDATRFISPTKTLEYMAAERPIVSTPIADVADPYGHIVYLGATPESFVSACERALAAPVAERAHRVSAMRDVLAGTSWDATVAAMDRLITKALAMSLTKA